MGAHLLPLTAPQRHNLTPLAPLGSIAFNFWVTRSYSQVRHNTLVERTGDSHSPTFESVAKTDAASMIPPSVSLSWLGNGRAPPVLGAFPQVSIPPISIFFFYNGLCFTSIDLPIIPPRGSTWAGKPHATSHYSTLRLPILATNATLQLTVGGKMDLDRDGTSVHRSTSLDRTLQGFLISSTSCGCCCRCERVILNIPYPKS
jgi:hypothetical protein